MNKFSQEIYDLSIQYDTFSFEELFEKLDTLKIKLRLNKLNDDELKQVFAICVQLCFMVTQKRAYKVQIMGAVSLYKQHIIQMSTGEGKTLTASIAATVLALKGKSVHILTSNDYLSSRDANLFSAFYNKVGLNVGAVISSTSIEDRKIIYKNNIVYSTGKEILADFLKDRMKEPQKFNINSFFINKLFDKKKLDNNYLLRGLDCVIVDEADSVLADDAITPLIISAKSENKLLKQAVIDANFIASKLEHEVHYIVNERYLEVVLTKHGVEFIEKFVESLSNIWHSKTRREFLIKQAILAIEIYKKDKQYIIKDGKIVIIDERTGRIMDGRSWGNGLHQAIEVKEGLEISDPTTTYSKMSFQRFFRLYSHLCGMSGTLSNLENELWQIYGKQIVKIPTRLDSKMKILKDKIYLTQEEKETALVEYIKEINSKELPILIGVTSIKESESLAKKLKSLNINCTALNALHDDEEAEIISNAGQKAKVTIATNMAGRGTDIHIDEEVNHIGGLHIVLTQKDKSRRVDLQFFGRCARQGQNGVAVAFLSLEDTILQNYLNPTILKYLENNFNNIISKKLILLIYRYYQNKIEKNISNIRKNILQNEFLLDDNMSYINKTY